jgi:hypothetical protein
VLVALAIAAFAGTESLRADGAARIEASGGQFRPAVAFGGTNSLTVWEDTRPLSSIAGTRVSPDGEVLDPNQILIVEAPGIQGFPDVASDGQNYLAAWTDERVASFREVYASRINYEGVVLDPAGIPVSTGACCRFTPAIGYGGDNYLVVWVHPAAEFTDIKGTRVTPDGAVLDPTGIPISLGPSWHWNPAVALTARITSSSGRTSAWTRMGSTAPGSRTTERFSTRTEFQSRARPLREIPRSPTTGRTISSSGKPPAPVETTSTEAA